jgi:hypothetical protein
MSGRRFRNNLKTKPQGAAIGLGSIVDIQALAPVINLGAGPINDRHSQGGSNETVLAFGDFTLGSLGLRPSRITAARGAGFGGPARRFCGWIAHQHDHLVRRRIHPGGHPERDYRDEPFAVP